MKQAFRKGMTLLLCFALLFTTVNFVDTSLAYANEQTETATIDFSRDKLITAETTYTIVLKDAAGKSYESDGSGKVFNVPITKGDSYYTYEFVPDDTEKYWGSKGKLWVYGDIDFKGLNLSDTERGFLVVEKEKVSVKVPTGADVKFYNRYRLYKELEEVEGTKTESGDEYDTYAFEIPKTKSGYFIVEKEGYVKWVGYLTDFTKDNSGESVIYKLEKLTDNPSQIIRDESQQYYEAGILLNGPSTKFIELDVGEYFDIYAFRAWQAVDSETGNDYADPNFTYEVLDGDSVTVDSEGRITAVKEGLSIVKVGYDALEYSDSHARLTRLVYSACWPEKAGIYAVNVGGNDDVKISTGIDLSEYDTLYYMSSLNGESTGIENTEYTFKPTAENDESMAVSVAKPTIAENGNITYTWENVTPSADGTCKVNLPKGRNVIKIASADSVKCHVVNVDDVDVEIQNKERPNEDLIVGDTALIKFKGLTTPIPKLGAIYNPAGVLIGYDNDGAKVISDSEVQYNISTAAQIEVPITESGEINLTGGHLESAVWGDSASSLPTQHQRMTKGGNLTTAYDGGDNPLGTANALCRLPDISFTVTEAWDAAELEKQEAGYLKSVKVGTGANKKNIKSISEEMLRTKFNDLITIGVDRLNSPQTKNSPLYITVEPVDSNAEIMLRYWQGTDKENATIINYTGASKLADKLSEIAEIIWVEIIVKPTSGYPKTYTYAIMPLPMQTKPNGLTQGYAYLDSVEIKAVDGQFSVSEGLIAAKPFSKDGLQIDFGYGICWYEREYTVNITANISKITASIDLVGEDATEYKAGTEIPLEKGTNKFTATAKAKGSTSTVTAQYTFYFERENSVQVQTTIPNGATIEIKNQRGKNMVGENGVYNLPAGTYTAYVEKEGYLTEIKEFTVADEDMVVSIDSLEKSPEQSGNVTVKIIGLNSNIKLSENTSISEPEDLKLKKYVDYNNGGYTALHAMLATLDNGISKAKYKCIKGKLTPSINLSGNEALGKNAGWICEINGKVCSDPANTLVKDGDVIEYYYNADYEGMQHAVFAEGVQKTITSGSDLSLTLLSKAVGTDDDKTACADAKILINGQDKNITTDENGKAVIPTSLISTPGQYTITAQKLNDSNQNILTYTAYILTVKKADSQQQTGKTTVYFRLIGDAVHDGINEHGSYVTWIATKEYSFNKDSVSVYEVFMKALKDAGLQQDGADSNYVKSIKAPTAYGGYWLSEFTNGKNSGWMYTVNGEHPEFGLKDFYVTNGDSIVWHYVEYDGHINALW